MSGHFLGRNPSFLLVWLGQILSQSGGRMYQMAMIWWILSSGYSNTGMLAGIFMVLTALPSVLFVKPIGALIDRSHSQRILVLTDLLAFATVGLVALALRNEWLVVWAAFGAGFLAACFQATLDPTLNKAVNDVVEAKDTESAVALLSSTQSLANFSGAVLGAMLIEYLGIWGTAALAASGYFVSSAATRLAKFRVAPRPAMGVAAPQSEVGVLEAYPALGKILIGFGLINFFATPTLVVLPIYTKKTLLGSPSMLGQLEASLWIGLLMGTFGARLIPTPTQKVKLTAVCLSVFGAALLVPGLVVDKLTYQIALWVGGAAIGINNVKFMAFFQEIVPPEMKGRFFALMQASVGFTFPIAYFLFGTLTDFFTPPQVCLIQGVGVVALALMFLNLAQAEAQLVPGTQCS